MVIKKKIKGEQFIKPKEEAIEIEEDEDEEEEESEEEM